MKDFLRILRRYLPSRRTVVVTGAVLVVWWMAVSIFQAHKPLPAGIVFSGEQLAVPAEGVELLIDATYRDGRGNRVIDQQIYDRVLEMITNARRLIVLDIFLLNAHTGADGVPYRPLSSEVTESLLSKRRTHPEVPILLITDPINEVYGGEPSPQLASLRAAGVQVVLTDLERLRDSNLLYSGPWRTFGSWWRDPRTRGILPNPLDSTASPVGLRSYLRLLNFKANHRKVVLADDGGAEWVTLVTSANAHDASSAHSNVALVVRGKLAHQVYAAEAAVARFSGTEPPLVELPSLTGTRPSGSYRVAYLTESAIRDRLLKTIDDSRAGDQIDVAVFYLSHQPLLRSLIRASRRGVRVRVVLDPAKDAFGRTKNGVPNRQSAEKLVRASGGAIQVRWIATHGEQFHTKLLARRGAGGLHLILGSANYTRRNLDAFNLEADLEIHAPRGSPLDRQIAAYFERLWANRDGSFTVSFEAYRDPSLLRRAIARIQERTGLCTF